MTTETNKMKWGSNKLWKRIAYISGAFALLISVLMVANYLQISKADPVNMTVIDQLAERLQNNPDDAQLREQIRMLDLLYRKAYFTSQWQIRTGGYLLLGFVALFTISIQVIEYRKKVNPVITDTGDDDSLFQRQKARRAIVLGGSLILATAALFAFLSSNELNNQFSNLSGEKDFSIEADVESGNIVVNDLSDNTTVQKETTIDTKKETESIESTQKQASAETAFAQNEGNKEANKEPEIETKKVSNPPQTANKISPNYPNFRGIDGIGISTKKNIPTDWDGATGKNVFWKTPLPLPGQNSPIIWGDKLFFTGAEEGKQEIYCLNRNTGKLLWTTSVGGSDKIPNVSGETGYAAPTAVTDGNFVYAIFATGDMAAVDFEGKIIWEKDFGLPKNHYGHSSSLMMANGNVIVQYDQQDKQKLMAIASHTGEIVWSEDRDVKISWASPIVVNTGSHTEIMTAADPYVISYDAYTGKELWRMECIGGEVGPSLAYANGIVFSVNDFSVLSAVKIGDKPTLLWESDEHLSDIPSPVATNKYLFMATSYGVFICYDALTGKKYWEYEIGNNIFASPMLVDGKIYVLDVPGVMHIIEPDKELKIINEPKLGEYSGSTPIFTDGRIYLKGTKNMYCIGK